MLSTKLKEYQHWYARSPAPDSFETDSQFFRAILISGVHGRTSLCDNQFF